MKNNKRFLLALFCLIFFLIIMYQIHFNGELWLDKVMINTVVLAGRTDFLNLFFTGFTFLASVLGLAIITVGTLYFLKSKVERLYFLGNLGGAVLISQILKMVVQRPRPLLCYRLVKETGYSFPSGHSMVSMVFYGYFIYLLWKSKKAKSLKNSLTLFLSILILGIGFSRIYLGVHYASDVIAGFSLGAFYVLMWINFRESRENMKQKSLFRSFYHAGEGIWSAFLSERNMKIHVLAVILVTFFGFYFQISTVEWMVCIILFGIVISAEIMNTAVETVVDIAMPEKNDKAKLAKDLSAGAVLVLAIISVIIAVLIFLPKIFL